MRQALLPLIAFASAITLPAHADIVTNGSFETGANPPTPGTFRNLPAGNTDITGWTVIQSDIDWGSQGFASNGTYALDLNGSHGAGGIAQTLATTPGVAYTILFDINANNSTPTAVTLTASAAGTSQSFTYDPALMPTRPWITESLTFTATAPTTQLTFLSTTSDPVYGPGLDDVRQDIPIPEPPAIALFALGIAATTLRRRRLPSPW